MSILVYIRSAIRKELLELVPYCRFVDISCKSQLLSLASRVDFVVKLYTALLDGERYVLLDELKVRASGSTSSSFPHHIRYDNDENKQRYDQLVECASGFKGRILALETTRPLLPGSECPTSVMEVLLKELEEVSTRFMENLDASDIHLYPLLSNHFDKNEQKNLVSKILDRLPPNIMQDLIPWMFSQLTIDELESMIRGLICRASPTQFCTMVESIADSVRMGTSDAVIWAELCARIPEVRMEVNRIDSAHSSERHGPVSEILRVHKAIRVDLNTLLARVQSLPTDGTHLTARTISPIIEHVNFLRDMVEDHSRAEDSILLPRLEDRKPGSTRAFAGDHCIERALFQALQECLRKLNNVTGEKETSELVWKLKVSLRTLRDDMARHLDMEEETLWPLVITLFDSEEQSQIVALIFGNIPAERLKMLLPWMIRVLSIAERNEMMEHILQVTRSTMFEKWLGSWMTKDMPEFANGNASLANVNSNGIPNRTANGISNSNRKRSPERKGASSSRKTLGAKRKVGNTNTTKRRVNRRMGNFEHGRENIQKMVKSIAMDDGLDLETKTRLMQDVMMTPFIESQEKREKRSAKDDDENCDKAAVRTYRIKEGNVKVLGCEHYERPIKVRAACCGKFYTCRHCHDAAEDHKMDRFATTEILCMECSTVQPVGEKCVNLECDLYTNDCSSSSNQNGTSNNNEANGTSDNKEESNEIRAMKKKESNETRAITNKELNTSTSRGRFSKYFCKMCILYDNDATKSLYHCPFCDVCRVGKGLGVDFFHCMKCNTCMNRKFERRHVCVENAAESDCPVCFEFLFTSTEPVKYLRCGHLMHQACYEIFSKRCISCPSCSRSIEGMGPVYERIDRWLSNEGSDRNGGPNGNGNGNRDEGSQGEERQGENVMKCMIHCHDCNTQSETQLRFLYLKCNKCGSFNCRRIR